jgi:S-adenosyl-L-methionine hydrolase (adenosine-forming)
MSAPIAILTDFGIDDPFVGIMKGVIAQIAPGAPTIDLTHQIPPGDILRAAISIWQSIAYFPKETLFLCVVDPGVGSTRKPLIIRSCIFGKDYTFIGPNNGIFSFVFAEKHQAHEISNPDLSLKKHSSTFHGRDIFAPATAHAWNGKTAREFGKAVMEHELVRLPQPRLREASPAHIEGQVLFSDHFGNILTSLGRFEWQEADILQFEPWLPGTSARQYNPSDIQIALPTGEKLNLVRTYADIPKQKQAALVGSSGLLEIVENQGKASDAVKLERGSLIKLVSAGSDF